MAENNFETLESFKYDQGNKIITLETNQSLQNFVTGNDLNSIADYLNKLKDNVNFLNETKISLDKIVDPDTGKIATSLLNSVQWFKVSNISELVTTDLNKINNETIIILNPRKNDIINEPDSPFYQIFYVKDKTDLANGFIPLNFDLNIVNSIPNDSIPISGEYIYDNCNSVGTTKFIHDYVSAVISAHLYNWETPFPIGTVFPNISNNLQEETNACCVKLNGQSVYNVDTKYSDFWKLINDNLKVEENKIVPTAFAPMLREWEQPRFIDATTYTSTNEYDDSNGNIYQITGFGDNIVDLNGSFDSNYTYYVYYSFNKETDVGVNSYTALNFKTVEPDATTKFSKECGLRFYSKNPLKINGFRFVRTSPNTTEPNAAFVKHFKVRLSTDGVTYTDVIDIPDYYFPDENTPTLSTGGAGIEFQRFYDVDLKNQLPTKLSEQTDGWHYIEFVALSNYGRIASVDFPTIFINAENVYQLGKLNTDSPITQIDKDYFDYLNKKFGFTTYIARDFNNATNANINVPNFEGFYSFASNIENLPVIGNNEIIFFKNGLNNEGGLQTLPWTNGITDGGTTVINSKLNTTNNIGYFGMSSPNQYLSTNYNAFDNYFNIGVSENKERSGLITDLIEFNKLNKDNKFNYYMCLANGTVPAALKRDPDLNLVNTMPLGTIYNVAGASVPSGAFALNGQLIENCFEKYLDFWNHITTNVDVYEYSSGALEIINENWENSALTINNVYGSNKVGEINIDKNNPIYVSRDTTGNITNSKIAVNDWYTVPYGEGRDWGINYNKPMIATTTPYNSTRVGWKSFDYLNYKSENYNTCFMSYTGAGAITFYNPLPIQLTNVIFTRSYNFGQGFYQLRVAKIYGSTNNKDWELLADNSNKPWIAGTGPNEDNYKGDSLSYTNPEPISLDLTITSEKAFNYIKIIGHRDTAWQNAAANNCCEFGQIRLVGKECNYIDESLEKIFTIGKESDKNIKVLNIEQAEKFNTAHPGNSIFFGIDFTKEIEEIEEIDGTSVTVIKNIEFDTDSKVKLPDYSSLTLLESNIIPVHGNGMTLGLTDGTSLLGLRNCSDARSYGIASSEGAYSKPFGMNLASAIGNANVGKNNTSIGVTEDSDNSGLVADITSNSLITNKINWVIQVYNAITDVSVYDPSSLINTFNIKLNEIESKINDIETNLKNIDYVIEQYYDNTTTFWYRLYKSGWLEQGGGTRRL